MVTCTGGGRWGTCARLVLLATPLRSKANTMTFSTPISLA